MPLVRNESGDFVAAQCVNGCGTLSRIDQSLSLVGKPGEDPPQITVLVCPICHYCETYWGAA